MGLPIQQLHIITNQNDILHSSIAQGLMKKILLHKQLVQVWTSRFQAILKGSYLKVQTETVPIKDMFQEFSKIRSMPLKKHDR